MVSQVECELAEAQNYARSLSEILRELMRADVEGGAATLVHDAWRRGQALAKSLGYLESTVRRELDSLK